MKKCSNCRKVGHNARTCGVSRIPFSVTGPRKRNNFGALSTKTANKNRKFLYQRADGSVTKKNSDGTWAGDAPRKDRSKALGALPTQKRRAAPGFSSEGESNINSVYKKYSDLNFPVHRGEKPLSIFGESVEEKGEPKWEPKWEPDGGPKGGPGPLPPRPPAGAAAKIPKKKTHKHKPARLKTFNAQPTRTMGTRRYNAY